MADLSASAGVAVRPEFSMTQSWKPAERGDSEPSDRSDQSDQSDRSDRSDRTRTPRRASAADILVGRGTILSQARGEGLRPMPSFIGILPLGRAMESLMRLADVPGMLR